MNIAKKLNIVSILCILITLSGCSGYYDTEVPLHFENASLEDRIVDITLIDVMQNNKQRINRERIVLGSGESTGVLHPEYEASKELTLHIEIVEDEEVIYSFTQETPTKGISYVILEGPLRIEKQWRKYE